MKRRRFLQLSTAAGALTVVPKTALSQVDRIREIVGAALSAAKAAGATYADVRVVRLRAEDLAVRDDHVDDASASESFGLGVRVLAKGAWGFCGTQDVSVNGAKAAAGKAIAIARANVALLAAPVQLAAAPPALDAWQTPLSKDPFRVPLENKLGLLLATAKAAHVDGVPVVAAECSLRIRAEDKTFFSSEGAQVDQTIVRIDPSVSVTVADAGDFESRRSSLAPRGLGWEYVEDADLPGDAPRLAREALEKMKADAVVAGEKDLVLLPTNLWLTIHESLGHSTELDRAMGYEANFAGTSFATPDQIGKLRYGGALMNVYADRTTPGGLATAGYDDDGQKTQRFDLIKQGVLADFQTTREQAAWIGAASGHACAYADSWASVPFQRMPNVSLAPADADVTLDQLVAGVTDGILVDGTGSYSIDQQRLNFQFSGDAFHEIKDGKVGRPLRYVAYQSSTPVFWSSMDAIGGSKLWWMGGAFDDGKGEPTQSNPVSHGCAPSRFRKIRVLDARGKQ